MKKSLIIMPILMLLALAAIVLPRRPQIWFCKEYAGISFTRPNNYESWNLRFCDGLQSSINGDMHPVTFEYGPGGGITNIRPGFYHWPKFEHVAFGWQFTNNAILTTNQMSDGFIR
jgi:hypothetical protein